MREYKNFWDRNAGWYDRFMQKDCAAYEKMYVLIRPVVKAKTVLELATGTGLIAKNIVNAAAHIEATDASAEMIAEAKRGNCSAKLHFSVQDMFCLPYADKSFDVVIVSNAPTTSPTATDTTTVRSVRDCGSCIWSSISPTCSPPRSAPGATPTRWELDFTSDSDVRRTKYSGSHRHTDSIRRKRVH